MDELQNSIKMRKEDEFLSPTTSAEKRALIDKGYDSDVFTGPCNEFFGIFDSFYELSTFGGLDTRNLLVFDFQFQTMHFITSICGWHH